MTTALHEAPAAALTIGDMAFQTIPAGLDGLEMIHYWRGYSRAERAYAKKHGRPGVTHGPEGAPRPGTPEHDALAAELAAQGRAYREAVRPVAHAAGMRAVHKLWQERGLEHRAAEITDPLAPVAAPRKRAAQKPKPVAVESAPVETVPSAADLAKLQRAATKAAEREARLVARYNRDYAAGKFTTNRPLAAQCEAAYSAKYEAAAALAAAREAAGLPPVESAEPVTVETIAAAAPSASEAAALRAGVESGRIVVMHVGKESPRKAAEAEPEPEPVAVENAEPEPAPEESAAYWAGVRARKALRRELAAAMRARGVEPRGEAWARECKAAGLPVGGEA